MYEKNLSEDLRIRLSNNDLEFLKLISSQRNCSVSECVRSIIGEYRRSIESLEIFKKAIDIIKE